jgi:hypothetical protein
MKNRSAILLALIVLLIPLWTHAGDWPQWRGPNRDDRATETGLLKTWPKAGPTLLWTYTNAGIGYSGPAVVADRLFLMGAREGT